MRTLATPYGTTGLAVVDVAMVRVRHRTDRSKAGARNEALLAGVQPQDRHAGIAADELHVSACRAGDLAALARLHFDVVNDRTNRDVLQRHGVAGLDVDSLV
ncbi:hypothetical protein D3C87_1916980 [compost metagenome]